MSQNKVKENPWMEKGGQDKGINSDFKEKENGSEDNKNSVIRGNSEARSPDSSGYNFPIEADPWSIVILGQL